MAPASYISAKSLITASMGGQAAENSPLVYDNKD